MDVEQCLLLPAPPSSSNQEDRQQLAEETGHVYKDKLSEAYILPPAPKKIERPHLKQRDYEREALTLLSEMTTPIPARGILQNLEGRMRSRFSAADLESTEATRGKSNTPRWKVTARFAIYAGLKKKGLISAVSKNQWVITPTGREFISKTTAT